MSFFRRVFGVEQPSDNLRIVITRHGERADFTLGKQWFRQMQRNGGRDPRISRLARRAHIHEWNYDSPLTIDGEQQSASVGKQLLRRGCPIDYCYSSPAYRSIQTANRILESQGRKAVPINIEPGLFECPSWYTSQPLAFISPQQLATDRRFNIDPTYVPLYDGVDPSEDERDYYKQSRHLINEIIKAHKAQGGTILLAGHGGSIEAVTRGLRGLRHRRGHPERLIQEALRVEYCNFAIIERDARTRRWTVRQPESSDNAYEVQLTLQSTIPLFGVTARPHVQRARVHSSPARHSRHDKISYNHYSR